VRPFRWIFKPSLRACPPEGFRRAGGDRFAGDPRGSTGMVAVDEGRRSAQADNRFYPAKRMVEVSKIVCSVALPPI
jgi:hypothetical protein